MNPHEHQRPTNSIMQCAVPFPKEDRSSSWRWRPENNVLGPKSVMATCPSCDTRQQTIVNTYASNRGQRFTHICPACGAIIGTYQS